METDFAEEQGNTYPCPSGKAVVFVMRPQRYIGCLNGFTLKLNDEKFAKVWSRKYAWALVDVGEQWKIRIKGIEWWNLKGKVKAPVQQEGYIYVKLYVKRDEARLKLILDATKGLETLRKCKLTTNNRFAWVDKKKATYCETGKYAKSKKKKKN